MVSRLAEAGSNGSNLIYIHGRLNIFKAKPPSPNHTAVTLQVNPPPPNTANLFLLALFTYHMNQPLPGETV